MKRVFRITPAFKQSYLTVAPGLPYSGEMSRFQGESKAALSPEAAFEGKVRGDYVWNEFCLFAPGALAVPEAAWERCEEMYYNLASGGSELLAVSVSGQNFWVINPTTFAPMRDGGGPQVDFEGFFSVLFRIPSSPKSEIFCMSNPEASGDDFKKVYEENGFNGLMFEEV